MSSGSDSESGDSVATFSSLERSLTKLRTTLEEYDELAAGIQTHMEHMETPVTSVALASFAQPTYLKEAPFRFERFHIREEAQRLFGLEETASFRTLCKHVRDTLFREGCVGSDGLVTLTPALSEFFGVQGAVSYLSLLVLEKFVE
jgi:hypothetical protein